MCTILNESGLFLSLHNNVQHVIEQKHGLLGQAEVEKVSFVAAFELFELHQMTD